MEEADEVLPPLRTFLDVHHCTLLTDNQLVHTGKGSQEKESAALGKHITLLCQGLGVKGTMGGLGAAASWWSAFS